MPKTFLVRKRACSRKIWSSIDSHGDSEILHDVSRNHQSAEEENSISPEATLGEREVKGISCNEF